MRKSRVVHALILAIITVFLSGFLVVPTVSAATPTRTRVKASPIPSPSPEPTATVSAQVATPSATPIGKTDNITETTGEVKGRLESYLLEQPLGRLNVTNFVRHAMRYAVRQGVPATTLVLLLLFPMVAMIVASARHLIGLRGFGIYIPAVLSIAFVATGVLPGILLFVVILTLATYGMRLFKPLHLQYLPRMALLIWLVSVGVFATVLAASWFGIHELLSLNIFPILILILLVENFNEVRMGKSRQEATDLTIETIIMSLIGGLIMSLDFVQKFALLNPEILLLLVAGINILVGKYAGLRFTEYLKFKQLMES